MEKEQQQHSECLLFHSKLKSNVNACARLADGTAHRLLIQLEASVLRLTTVKSTTETDDVPTIHADDLRCNIGVAGTNLNGIGWLGYGLSVSNRRTLALDWSDLHGDGAN